jgi:inositol hexakisphosphate/diphosphoinositol-pentakisphosphate kinase
MLRTRTKTYVCDVNGFSFVKTSDKYYEDCATQILSIIYRKLNIGQEAFFPDNFSQKSNISKPYRPHPASTSKKGWELRSIVAVFRHGDRTPKQKMKFQTEDMDFLKLFNDQTKAIKLKTPRELQKVLLITIEKIAAMLESKTPDAEEEMYNEKTELEKLVQLKYILEKDRFEGFSRKI